jgi:hypothetical protein
VSIFLILCLVSAAFLVGGFLWPWLGSRHPEICPICSGSYKLGSLSEHFLTPECRRVREELGSAEVIRRLRG